MPAKPSIPSGPFCFSIFAEAIALKCWCLLAILLAAPLLHAAFLAGEGKIGQPVAVLCEGQGEIYVSQPDGKQQKLLLDGNSQAKFIPGLPGPYAVQCGNETLVVQVAQVPAANAQYLAVEQGEPLLLAGLAVLLVLFLLAAALLAWKLVCCGTEFSKEVENCRAGLHLRAGGRLEKIAIADPVAIGFPGKEMRFEIPALGAGKEWRFEYEIADGETALPASLSAREGGKTISLLSTLFIAGNIQAQKEEAGGKSKEKKMLPKAGKEEKAQEKRKLPKAR